MNNKTPLSMSGAKAIADSLKTFRELEDKKIRTPNDDSEQAGLEQFLHDELLAHAGEFLNCWIAVRSEYEPLVHAVAAVVRRATALNNPPTKEAA